MLRSPYYLVKLLIADAKLRRHALASMEMAVHA
jgi:hypothetical protein